MSGRFLLDTNIIIALLNGDDAAISGRPAENVNRVERFASGRAIVLCDLDVAREYGRLKQRLKEKGRPLPENDIWIAATAKRHGMTLVTYAMHC